MLALESGDAGLHRYRVVHGTARVIDGSAVPLLQRLAEIHFGPRDSISATVGPGSIKL